MTKEELEKATGQELIEQRNYCGVDGYYGDYLDNVNAEMLKRFNRLADLEVQNKWLEGCKLELGEHLGKANDKIADLEKENAELKHTIATLRQEKDNVSMHAKAMEVVAKTKSDQLTKAKEIIKELVRVEYADFTNGDYSNELSKVLEQAEQFLNSEVEK